MNGTIIFAGGGSGGHIFPALAIAEQVRIIADQTNAPQPRLVFVCSERPLDSQILKESQVSFVTSPARPMIASPKGLARFLAAWPRAVRGGRRLLRDAKRLGPVHVCATGGFVAAPMVGAARREGVGIMLVNLDAVPGKANRWIAPRADSVISATRVQRSPRRGPEWLIVPPIVRRSAPHASQTDQAECRTRLGLDPRRPVLMITTGSQGLRSVNDFLVAFAASPEGLCCLGSGRWQILHQTGRAMDAGVREAYEAVGIDARVEPFTPEMADWWGAAEVAVATAGAGNVAEAWSNRVPALFLPYPHHRDQHQKFNAQVLEESGGAVVGTDLIDADANVRANGPGLVDVLSHPERRAAMRAALDRLGPADGAARVARRLLEVVYSPAPAPRKTA